MAKHLIPEIRIETARFYGSLDSIEARYPGLNYTFQPHIDRLSRFANHARLFKAFKQLGLTGSEILDLVRWEGTLWARERFERDEDLKVVDTTGDGIKPWVPHSQRPPVKAGIKKDVSFIVTGEDIKSTHLALPDMAIDSAVASPSIGSIEHVSASEDSCDEEDEDEDDVDVDEIIHEIRAIRRANAYLARFDNEDGTDDSETNDDESSDAIEPPEATMLGLPAYYRIPPNAFGAEGISGQEDPADEAPKEPSEDDLWLSALPPATDPSTSASERPMTLANILNTASSIRAGEEAPTITQPAG